MPPDWNGQDPLAAGDPLRCLDLKVPEEGVQGGEAMVDRGLPITAFLLQVVQEAHDQIGVDVVEAQSFRSYLALVAAVFEEEGECVPIGLHRVRARISLRR